MLLANPPVMMMMVSPSARSTTAMRASFIRFWPGLMGFLNGPPGLSSPLRRQVQSPIWQRIVGTARVKRDQGRTSNRLQAMTTNSKTNAAMKGSRRPNEAQTMISAKASPATRRRHSAINRMLNFHLRPSSSSSLSGPRPDWSRGR